MFTRDFQPPNIPAKYDPPLSVKDFDRTFDIAHLNKWLFAYDMPLLVLSDLPILGYMAYIDLYHMGSIFLRNCGGDLGMIDGFIINPECELTHRSKILDLLVARVIGDARCMGMKKLIGFTSLDSVVKRAMKFNFGMMNSHKVLLLDLEVKTS